MKGQGKLDIDDYSISAIIPAYNCGGFIGRAIESVLRQTLPADEIIVINDGSQDDTDSVIRSFGDRIIYINQPHAGSSATRNTGINAAKSTWIAFLDGDDEWLADKLKLQVQHLRQNRHLQWSTGNFFTCLCRENRVAPALTSARCRAALGQNEYFPSYFDAYRHGFTGHTDVTIVRKDILIEAGLFRPGQRRFNDLDLLLRVAYLQPCIGFISEPLAIYHLDIDHSISQMPKRAEIFCDLIERHLALSAQYGMAESFRPLAKHLLRCWIRGMLFDNIPGDVKEMVSRFDLLLPAGYRFFIRALAAFPKTTAAGCYAISKIVRALKLRRQAVRRP